MKNSSQKQLHVACIFNTTDRPETHLVIALAKKPNLKVDILCNTKSGHYREFEKANVRYTHFECKSRVDFGSILKLRRYFADNQFDIVHCFTAKILANVFLAQCLLRKAERSKLIAYRGVVGNVSKWDPTAWLTYFNPFLSRISCVSKAVERYLLSAGVSPAKLQTIYKGHSSSWYDDVQPIARRELGVAEDSLLVAIVSNVRPAKGGDVVLQAARQLKQSGKVEFVFVGEVKDPDFKESLERLKLPHVHLLGYRDDALSIIAASDVLAQVSTKKEGLPKTVLEAMYLKTCAVVSEAGGMPELIRDGEDGFVLSCGDSNALYQRLLELRDKELRAQLAKSAHARCLAKFSIEKTIAETEELYHAVVEG